MFNYGSIMVDLQDLLILSSATIIEHFKLYVVILLGFLLLFLTLFENGSLETPTLVYEKNARVGKSLNFQQSWRKKKLPLAFSLY